MKVKELIEALAEQDPESPVHVAIVEFGEQRVGKWTNPIRGLSRGQFNTVLLHRPTDGSAIAMEDRRGNIE